MIRPPAQYISVAMELLGTPHGLLGLSSVVTHLSGFHEEEESELGSLFLFLLGPSHAWEPVDSLDKLRLTLVL